MTKDKPTDRQPAQGAEPKKDEPPTVAESQAHFKSVGLTVHTHNITQVPSSYLITDDSNVNSPQDYKISRQVLGVGINGKVVECYNRKTHKKYALKVLRDVPKARREIELHYMTCSHKNIVKIYDVYENTYNGVRCLLVVMEW